MVRLLLHVLGRKPELGGPPRHPSAARLRRFPFAPSRAFSTSGEIVESREIFPRKAASSLSEKGGFPRRRGVRFVRTMEVRGAVDEQDLSPV